MVDRDGLENRCTLTGTEGSNPSLSAGKPAKNAGFVVYYLKLLAAGAGITKNLNAHVTRYSFATYLINNDIPIESVSKSLGHANIKQTQYYARLAGKKVVNDMSKLLKK